MHQNAADRRQQTARLLPNPQLTSRPDSDLPHLITSRFHILDPKAAFTVVWALENGLLVIYEPVSGV